MKHILPPVHLPLPRANAPITTSVRAAHGSIFSALRYRNYRLFWSGQLVSVTGTFMMTTAQQWLVLTLSGDPLALGVVGALQFGPLLLLGPFGGAIADRWPRRNVLVGTMVASGMISFILWLLTATGAVQLWHVFVLAALLGLVNAVGMPTRQAFVSEMVPADSLLNAVSLNSAQFNASRIVGPGLAGGLIALLGGTSPLFLFDALSYLAVIGSLLMMRSADLMPVPHTAPQHGLARLRALGDGIRFVMERPSLRVTFLMIAVIGTMGFNFSVLLPLEATDVLQSGAMVFGLLSSALGVGALLGALLLARRTGAPTNRMLISMAVVFGILESAMALTRSVPIALVMIAITGYAMSSFSASANTRTQLSSPPEMRGRVMSVYTMVFIGTTPIGSLLISSVASAFGVPVAFVVSGVPCFIVACVAAWLWRRQDAHRVSDAALEETSSPAPSFEADEAEARELELAD
jgi:MFS family permease